MINFGLISHRFRDVANFLLSNAHFSTSPSIQPQIKNVAPALHPQISYSENLDTAKFLSKTYPLVHSLHLHTDG